MSSPPLHRSLGGSLRALRTGFLWAGLVLLLASCSQSTAPQRASSPADETFARVATLPLSADADRAAFEAELDGAVLSWRPELGFAIVGLHQDAAALGGDGTALASVAESDSNVDAVALGVSAWAGGFSAWAGGASAWAGGPSAWAGGVSAWAGGSSEDNPFPGNEDEWAYLRLFEAQGLAPNMGAGVKVAVIDTGIDLDHPAFTDRLAPQSEWIDYVDDDAWPDEVGSEANVGYGHGTAVAGIILQVAPNATILPLRVLDSDGYGDLADVVSAVDHAARSGADIINLSLGSSEPLKSLEQVLQIANAYGVPVIASGGNSGTQGLTYPAQLATDSKLGLFTFSVGSVNLRDRKSSFSNYDPAMEIHAPGEAITTLYPDGRIIAASGTSFSAPWIAGTGALLLSELMHGTLSANAADFASDGGLDIEKANHRDYRGMLGYGRIDIATLFEALGGGGDGGGKGGRK